MRVGTLLHEMLGDVTPDEFPVINGFRPPVSRAEIDEFSLDDALILLDGDGIPGGHGYHRNGLGIKSSEFPPGWGEREVMTWYVGIRDIGLVGSALSADSSADAGNRPA
jgi:hypothetical protein